MAAFDVVLASNVIEHFEPEAAAGIVSEVVRLLRRGGRADRRFSRTSATPIAQYFDDYTHRSTFTHVSLANLLRSQGAA